MSFVPRGFEKVCGKTKTYFARPIYAVFYKSLVKKKLMIKFQITKWSKVWFGWFHYISSTWPTGQSFPLT